MIYKCVEFLLIKIEFYHKLNTCRMRRYQLRPLGRGWQLFRLKCESYLNKKAFKGLHHLSYSHRLLSQIRFNDFKLMILLVVLLSEHSHMPLLTFQISFLVMPILLHLSPLAQLEKLMQKPLMWLYLMLNLLHQQPDQK